MGTRLLYRDTSKGFNPDSHEPAEGHVGLWYDKFCNQWDKDEWTIDGKGKKEWIEQIPQRVPFVGMRQEMVQRRQEMIGRLGGMEIMLKTASRFVTGMGREHPTENGFAWHHSLGAPYLPGSSLKGAVRAWIGEWKETGSEPDLKQRLFGSHDKTEADGETASGIGSVIFFDALPVGQVKLCPDVMTPHYSEYYQQGEVPGDWLSPVPIPFLTVDAGAKFQFCLAPRSQGNSQHRKDCRLVQECLPEALEWLGAGAKTAVGYGRFTPT